MLCQTNHLFPPFHNNFTQSDHLLLALRSHTGSLIRYSNCILYSITFLPDRLNCYCSFFYEFIICCVSLLHSSVYLLRSSSICACVPLFYTGSKFHSVVYIALSLSLLLPLHTTKLKSTLHLHNTLIKQHHYIIIRTLL
jgi:hypothetical protein